MVMKIRTIKYFLGEGFTGIWKNSLMTLASIGTVIAALIIFGIFILFSTNLNYIGTQIQDEQEIRAFIDESMTAEQVQEIGRQIEDLAFVRECRLETKEQALENLREDLGEGNERILEGLDEDNPLRDAYIVKLKDIAYTREVAGEISSIDGIAVVREAEEAVDKLLNIMEVIRMFSLGIMILLAFIAVFIISNTIKLAVFARRKEINIMKFVGATDWFIRWPFIVEGMVIGLIGAVIALVLTGYGYSYTTEYISQNLGMFRLRQFDEVFEGVALIFISLGTTIGALGSAISIRKYLRV
ncbi:MAG: permease-like cell division protein FtsX [Firmicutes bacterium]|nr:permease-like cell division protein FtsX [Bacillota bacterium]